MKVLNYIFSAILLAVWIGLICYSVSSKTKSHNAVANQYNGNNSMSINSSSEEKPVEEKIKEQKELYERLLKNPKASPVRLEKEKQYLIRLIEEYRFEVNRIDESRASRHMIAERDKKLKEIDKLMEEANNLSTRPIQNEKK